MNLQTVSPARIPFVLFLVGVLAYGGAFAFSMLSRFDLINLVRDVNLDDSFYYFGIAQHLSEGSFSTFDGITRTNGYHPLWMLWITPIYWVFDSESALFAIKAFEVMLVGTASCLVVLATRLARLSWILLFALLPTFLVNSSLYAGMEAGAGLFCLAMYLLGLVLFARSPERWQWLFAIAVFILPWVRLEYIAVSLVGTSTLCLVEWRWKKRDGLACSISTLEARRPLFSAVSSILVYFTYNYLVFDGIIPVSGAVKQWHSQQIWDEMGGYDLVLNFKSLVSLRPFDNELLISLEVCVYLLLIGGALSRSRSREAWLMLVWMVGIFSFAAGHLTKFVQSLLLVAPAYANYPWYYVPGYLMTALIIPLRCYVLIYLIRRFFPQKFRHMAELFRLGVVVVGSVFLFRTVDFMEPFKWIDDKFDGVNDQWYEWEISSYAGTLIMNHLLPEGSVVGSSDAGAIGYFSRHPVVSLDGLVNSYDFFRRRLMKSHDDFDEIGPEFFRKFGVTHYANAISILENPDDTLFEGARFPETPRSSDRKRFKLISIGTPQGIEGALNRRGSFWERIEPHFDYRFESEPIGIIIDGRLALSITRDCVLAERAIILQYTTRDGETNTATQRPWKTGREGGSTLACGDVTLLPPDTIHPLRIWLTPKDVPERDLTLYGFDNWRLDGDAVTIYDQHERTVDQQPITGNVTERFLTSYHPNRGDAEIGTAHSPEFTVADGQLLTFLIAGGGGGVGVRLLADGAEVKVWHGKHTEHFEAVSYPLDGLADKTLQLELFDSEVGGWGHIMLDHVRLTESAMEAPPQ